MTFGLLFVLAFVVAYAVGAHSEIRTLKERLGTSEEQVKALSDGILDKENETTTTEEKPRQQESKKKGASLLRPGARSCQTCKYRMGSSRDEVFICEQAPSPNGATKYYFCHEVVKRLDDPLDCPAYKKKKD